MRKLQWILGSLAVIGFGMIFVSAPGRDQPTPPTKQATHPPKAKMAKIAIVGMGGTCIKCGNDFTTEPNEDGVVVLTPVCPDCQKR